MIGKMMGKMGMAEDEPIQNYIITRSLETAQTKIEGFNFDARKHVLEYDDVMNHQRKIVYDRRRKILLGDENSSKEYLEELVAGDTELKKVIDERVTVVGEKPYYLAVRNLILQTIDLFWVEHLEVMDYLRGSVNLRAYGQRDPLVEYKREGLQLFKDMQESISGQILKLIPNIGAGAFARETSELEKVKSQAIELGGSSNSTDSGNSKSAPKAKDGTEIGRNDPCFCGSGKKYKKCGILNSEEHNKFIAKK
jgi:preprotein translocase subunit SecA